MRIKRPYINYIIYNAWTTEKLKIEKETKKEADGLRLEVETKKAEAEAQKATDKMKLQAQAERDRRVLVRKESHGTRV